MYWNYRLLKMGDDMYTLVEAYYEDGVVGAYAEPHELWSESPDEMRKVLLLALEACDKPPIALVDGKVVEVAKGVAYGCNI